MFNNRCSIENHKKQFIFLPLLTVLHHQAKHKKPNEKCYLNEVIDEKLIEKLMPNDEQITKTFQQ